MESKNEIYYRNETVGKVIENIDEMNIDDSKCMVDSKCNTDY